MTRKLSRIVSPREVVTYFTHPGAEVTRKRNGLIRVKSGVFDMSLRQGRTMFSVEVASVDDPFDSKSGTTDDPVKFISDFLKAESGEDRVSSGPDGVAYSIMELAAMVDRGMPVGAAAAAMRRMVARLSGRFDLPGEDERGIGIRSLQEEVRAKGWGVDAKDGGRLEVDVHGLFTAAIEPETATWDYRFEVVGVEGAVWSGSAEDPIAEFRRFYKSDAVQEAKEEAQARRVEAPTVGPRV